jgi:hypothetical protein
MSLSRIAAHTRAAGRYRTGSNDSEPGLRCQYRPPRYTCKASGRSPGSRAGLIPVNHLPAPCAVVCRFTLSRLPLRGQRRNCQGWLTHRLPVSSLGRPSSGHLKQRAATVMSAVKGVKAVFGIGSWATRQGVFIRQGFQSDFRIGCDRTRWRKRVLWCVRQCVAFPPGRPGSG